MEGARVVSSYIMALSHVLATALSSFQERHRPKMITKCQIKNYCSLRAVTTRHRGFAFRFDACVTIIYVLLEKLNICLFNFGNGFKMK